MKISDGWIFLIAIAAFLLGGAYGLRQGMDDACEALQVEGKADGTWYQLKCNEED